MKKVFENTFLVDVVIKDITLKHRDISITTTPHYVSTKGAQ